ncbi:peptide MFS transporter [Steroidobacter sp.]|uniref:peptide MFS transporter n=1 Tax=Steroidobacter sp. TaxID=1978227 RepID=UPI001A644FBE|nr:oligopeptide:H+ symporter [Steroidobacter sp.]MBL8269259.1 hypothetical protein [Steroidobacter sp.]
MLSAIVLAGLLLTVATAIPVSVQIARRHPRGLFILFFTEMWERFSFYGMRTLLIFYLTQHFLFSDESASHHFGSFTTLAYLLPLIGGVLADKYLGARKAVAFGALLLVAGHLSMAVEGPPAQQSLSYQGQSFDVRSEGTGSNRHLVLVAGNSEHKLVPESSGALRVEGVDGSSQLPSVLAPGDYELSASRQTFYEWILYTALALIAMGVGFLKGNVSTLVGQLYGPDDPRRDAGFTLYYFGINLGGFWSAILCAYLGETYGWQWGFGLAGVGMLLGYVVFVLGQRWLQGNGEPPSPAALTQRVVGPINREWLIYLASLAALVPVVLLLKRNELVGWVLLIASVGALAYVLRYTLLHCDPLQRRRMYVALLLVAGAVVFWTLFLQAGTSLNLFADRNTDLRLLTSPVTFDLFGTQFFLGTKEMFVADGQPAGNVLIDTTLTAGQVQAFNVAFVLIFAPVFSWLWTWLGSRGWEPGPVAKFGYGLIQVGLGFLVIVMSLTLADEQFRVPLFVLGLTYLLHTTGELFVSPVGMAELTKLSPPMLVSTMMAVWLLTSSIAQFLGALIASFAGTETVAGRVLSPERALQSSVAVFEYVGWAGIACGVVFLAINPWVRRWLAEPAR